MFFGTSTVEASPVKRTDVKSHWFSGERKKLFGAPGPVAILGSVPPKDQKKKAGPRFGQGAAKKKRLSANSLKEMGGEVNALMCGKEPLVRSG